MEQQTLEDHYSLYGKPEIKKGQHNISQGVFSYEIVDDLFIKENHYPDSGILEAWLKYKNWKFKGTVYDYHILIPPKQMFKLEAKVNELWKKYGIPTPTLVFSTFDTLVYEFIPGEDLSLWLEKNEQNYRKPLELVVENFYKMYSVAKYNLEPQVLHTDAILDNVLYFNGRIYFLDSSQKISNQPLDVLFAKMMTHFVYSLYQHPHTKAIDYFIYLISDDKELLERMIDVNKPLTLFKRILDKIDLKILNYVRKKQNKYARKRSLIAMPDAISKISEMLKKAIKEH